VPVRFKQIEDLDLGALCFLPHGRRVGRERVRQPPNGALRFAVMRAARAGAGSPERSPVMGGR